MVLLQNVGLQIQLVTIYVVVHVTTYVYYVLQKVKFPKPWKLRPNDKYPKLQGDDENIWNVVLDTFEEGQHDGQSSLEGDESDHGDLIGVTHIQA